MLQFGMSRYVMRVKEELQSPKHVELLNVMNKINHQILCVLLGYRYSILAIHLLL